MVQHVKHAIVRGAGFWKVFWKGGLSGESRTDERTPELMTLPEVPA